MGESTVQFSAATCTVPEISGTVLLTVQRTGDTNTAVSLDYATADGTATNGLKYISTNGTLAFGAGETNRTIAVPILNNGLVEGTKTFKVILSNPTNAVLGTRTTATVSITDNDKGLHFYVPAISVNEDAGAVEIKVARGDDGDTPVSVDYATTDVTALAGQDYTTNAGTIVFAPGEVLKLFIVPLLNDALAEPTKTFRVSLSNPTGGVLSTPIFVTVTITNTDQVVQFDSTKYYVREEAEFVQIGVARGESDSAATLDFTTSDGTAKAGLDCAGVTNTIQFGAGERLKRITVPILNDPLKESSSESFQIRLSNPTGGAVLGSWATATVTIADNDPGVGFTTNTFSASASAGVANVTVVRGRDELLSSFTVDYQTANGSAQAGVDYQTNSGTLTFEANQTLQAVTIPLLQNPAARGIKYFTVTLNNASDSSPLGIATTRVNLFHPAAYYPILPPIDAKPKLGREDGVNLLCWQGVGVLQRAGQVSGPWENLAGVASPYASRPSLPRGFYRIQSPRPTEVYVPSGYDGQTRLPLILFLHAMGRTNDAPDIIATVRGGFPLLPLAESRGFLLCYPSGTVDASGWWFWNGPDFLSFSGPDVDDSGYLRGVIEEIQRRFAVDPKRIYVTGYSSGGAMSHRLALEHADLIAGIASMSGATYYDPNSFHPFQPVHVLRIQGSLDGYLGGWITGGLPVVAEGPGAVRIVQIWAGYNGCQNPVFDAAPSLDLTLQVAGIDTTVLRYTQCPPGGSVELWTVNGGDHYLFWNQLAPHFLEYLVDWLLAHPKP